MEVRPRKEEEIALGVLPTVVETTAQEFLALRKLMESKGPEGVAKFQKWLEGKTILLERGRVWKEWPGIEGDREAEWKLNDRGFYQNSRR